MKRADFFASLHTAAPGSTPEAIQKWIDFAAECVSEEQYANFTPSKDPEANVENWLDTLCGGVYAVRAEYGAELAGRMVNLSLDNCCLYPGEMLQAAECLRDGGTAETITGKIASDEIESEQPYFPVPVHPLTERDCGPDILIRDREVPAGWWSSGWNRDISCGMGRCCWKANGTAADAIRLGVAWMGCTCGHRNCIAPPIRTMGGCGRSGRSSPRRRIIWLLLK